MAGSGHIDCPFEDRGISNRRQDFILAEVVCAELVQDTEHCSIYH